MSIKSKILNTLIGRLSFAFLVSYTVTFIVGDLVYSLRVGGNALYISIFFIVLVLICSGVIFFLMSKVEGKLFLYILLALPAIAFSVFHIYDIIKTTPLNFIAEIILLIVSILLAIAFIVTAFFISEEKLFQAKEKKREEIVQSVLESQDKYQKALERKRAEWENVIEEEE